MWSCTFHKVVQQQIRDKVLAWLVKYQFLLQFLSEFNSGKITKTVDRFAEVFVNIKVVYFLTHGVLRLTKQRDLRHVTVKFLLNKPKKISRDRRRQTKGKSLIQIENDTVK